MLVDINMRTNSLRAWILAARPKTLSGAAVPVMLGCAYAYHLCGTDTFLDGGWIAALLCFLFAFVMQIDANFINDYYDCVKKRDNEERLGPLRACQQGWVTLKAMKIAIALTTLLACIIGLPLVLYGGYELIAVGVACIVFCFLYTICFAQLGLGDVLVLLFFGIIPTVCTTYVIVPHEFQQWSMMPWTLGIATGMVIDCLLLVNNYRDKEHLSGYDRQEAYGISVYDVGSSGSGADTDRVWLFQCQYDTLFHCVFLPHWNLRKNEENRRG